MCCTMSAPCETDQLPHPWLVGAEGEVPSFASFWGVFQYQQPALQLSRHRLCVQQFNSDAVYPELVPDLRVQLYSRRQW